MLPIDRVFLTCIELDNRQELLPDRNVSLDFKVEPDGEQPISVRPVFVVACPGVMRSPTIDDAPNDLTQP